MTAMGAAYCRYARRMAGCGQPVVHRRSDPAPLYWRAPRSVMTGDQQHHTLAGGDRLLERAVDHAPGRVEVRPVQIKHAVRLQVARAETPIPSPIEGGAVLRTT
jgi:hypothetical protein